MSRRWWGLLLLAAVFAIHGVQCADGHTSDTASSASPQAITSLSNDMPTHVTAGTLVDGMAAASAAIGHAVTPLAVTTTVEKVTTGHHMPAGMVDHLWAVCLGVLSAGLAVLSTRRLIRRTTRTTAPGPAVAGVRAHLTLGGWSSPRPPDLSSLCILRI